MIPDAEIVSAILAHRKPIERKRLAGLLHVDDDAELAATLGRLTREGSLHRTPKPGPGSVTTFVYWPTAAGKTASAPTTPSPAAPPAQPVEVPPPMTTQHDVKARRQKILAFLSEHPGSKSGAIASELGLTSDAVDRDLWTLKTSGAIATVGEGRPFGYVLAPPATTTTAAPKKKRAEKPAPAKPRRAARKPAKRGRRLVRDAAIAPKVTAATGFRVALTSDDTLLMERPNTRERVELQPDEISVLTRFLRRLDQATTL
jgi:biotin operon repressor